MDEKQVPDKVSIEQIQALLDRILLPTPRPWLVLIGIVLVLSLFEVDRAAEGSYALHFRLTTLTVLLAALFWLPFLLKVIALTGGGLKTAAGEANILGLQQLLARLDSGTKREALSTYVALVESAESQSPKADQPKLRELRQDLENQLASLSPKTQEAHEQLRTFARLYEAMRETMPPGPERTFKMSTIVAQASATAKNAEDVVEDMRNLFADGSAGSRVVALAILRAKPDIRFFSEALDAIGNSRSAFEQYQALRAVEQMLPALNPDQKRQLDAILRDQRSGGRDKYITPDSDRWPLSGRILDAIG